MNKASEQHFFIFVFILFFPKSNRIPVTEREQSALNIISLSPHFFIALCLDNLFVHDLFSSRRDGYK